jgi:hypothetical protein
VAELYAKAQRRVRADDDSASKRDARPSIKLGRALAQVISAVSGEQLYSADTTEAQ